MQADKPRGRHLRLVYASFLAFVVIVGVISFNNYFAIVPRHISVQVGDSFPVSDDSGRSGIAGPLIAGLFTVSVYHQGVLVSTQTVHNLVTTIGERSIIQRMLSCGATSATSCTGTFSNGAVFVALTSLASPTAAAGDIYCFSATNTANELTANGLGRATGTYGGNSSTSHTITNTFTYTGSTSVTVTGVCVFDTSTPNNSHIMDEVALASTATVTANGDTIAITITYSH